MEEDYGKTYGIDKLAELLIERGIEFYVKDEMSLLFMDGSGNPHECWMAGAEENLVNVMIVVTPEQAVSVPDLNGVISENAELRELVKAFNWCTENFDLQCKCDSCPLGQSDKLTPECEVRMRELGMEAGE